MFLDIAVLHRLEVDFIGVDFVHQVSQYHVETSRIFVAFYRESMRSLYNLIILIHRLTSVDLLIIDHGIDLFKLACDLGLPQNCRHALAIEFLVVANAKVLLVGCHVKAQWIPYLLILTQFSHFIAALPHFAFNGLLECTHNWRQYGFL